MPLLAISLLAGGTWSARGDLIPPSVNAIPLGVRCECTVHWMHLRGSLWTQAVHNSRHNPE